MSDQKDPNRAARAEQALRIVEEMERAIAFRDDASFSLCRSAHTGKPRVWLWDFAGKLQPFNGESLLDALAQATTFTHSVIDEMGAWGEPSTTDAESDVEAFDRVMAGKASAAE